LLYGFFAELTPWPFRSGTGTHAYIDIVATHSKGNDVLAKCLPGFTFQAFRDAVGCPVSVYRVVFGEWTDFYKAIRIWLEKMPQE
jgi:hypothetical protein